MAAFEMDEILYELREHSAGLNCGRWDYIFSYLKRFRNRPEVILPDRSRVTMTVPFMRAYTLLTIKTCHRRGAPAIGGMAAQIPVKNDPEKNEAAMAKVREDKRREASDGHDGTWVAHPGLVPVAKEIFDELMPSPNQIDRKREDVQVTAEDLVAVPEGPITEQGVRTNLRVGLLYVEYWLRGYGAVAIDHLMEDAATAEISRAQLWQWIRHPEGKLEDGRKVTWELVESLMQEELDRIREEIGEDAFEKGKFNEARELLTRLINQEQLAEFPTLPRDTRTWIKSGEERKSSGGVRRPSPSALRSSKAASAAASGTTRAELIVRVGTQVPMKVCLIRSLSPSCDLRVKGEGDGIYTE